ncbi:type II toxin-antitoxin system RelE/ParE family toxin [Rhizobiales bacterium RZME27]|jgi:toxin ParE1/3/4|uniref:Type II toxin-antitoxin system RelE/ParE family toxin n=1 Tax=Endobacterium cereale TaxID=2663029 RepID=A0A6A8AFG5_9HYPH|nr:type II toxin-antitoxin system RelE/ParE family toxin [Endobacterium cereale]MEB2847092.1 type II toxin-antitoxin system RelE/ParE family toxin [Endobacterium cereale]MQY47491.1 type II toxin-antitoxin system RelE/ParE family toxin [Endobacterium cereale]
MDEIVWLDTALTDLETIGTYIARENPAAAATVIFRIVGAVSTLSWHSKLGRLMPDGTTRKLTIAGTSYVAFYRINGRIEILAILHTSRRWPQHLS